MQYQMHNAKQFFKQRNIYTATAGQADVYVYGAQLEQGSYPTSYIPTYGSAVTRSKDSCIKTGAADLIGQSEGVVFLDVKTIYNNGVTGAEKWYLEIRKDQNNSFGLGSAGGGQLGNRPIRFVTKINGVVVTETEPPNFSNSKIAIKYTSTEFKLFQNGILKTTIAKNIGGYVDIQFMEGAGDDLSMPLNKFLLFPTALTDSECIALTS